jgi:hypothetical protein
VAEVSPREYRVVLVSDHGQAQGSTFEQVSGRHLRDVVAELMEHPGPTHPVVTTAAGEEMRGRVDVLVREFARPAKAERVSNRHEAEPAQGADAIVVATSGASGTDSSAVHPEGRIDLAEFDRRWPALVPGLLETRGVGFVVGRRDEEVVVIGFEGEHHLVSGRVTGTDPLLPFGPRAAGDLLRLMRFRTAPALFVHSTLDPVTGEVHAFEEQVGSHGGLGGGQTEAVLVHPVEWKVAEDLRDRSVPGEAPLVGAATIHEQLVRWMGEVGL